MRKIVNFCILFFVALFLFSCSAKESKSMYAAQTDRATGAINYELEEAVTEPMEAPAPAAILKTKSVAMNTANYKTANSGNVLLSENVKNLNVKLIYRANIDVQTLDYNTTADALFSMVENVGGYFESVYKYNGNINNSYNFGSLPYGRFTIRIPSERYGEFINSIEKNSHVVNIEQSVEDVSLHYSDIEQRLKTLSTKHDRLIDLLSKADKMKDIIDLESALSECEFSIDNYTREKTTYDSLIGFSTVNLNLEEVKRLEQSATETKLSFAEEFVKSVKKGFNSAIDFCRNVILWIASHIIGIAFWSCIIFALVRTIKNVQKNKKEKTKKD